MPSAVQIFNQSLGLLGVKTPGQPISGGLLPDSLVRLNTMLDAWRLDSLKAYAVQRLTANVSTATRTIGPAGDFVIDPRPTRIEPGSFFTSGGVDYPVTPVSAQQFNAIAVKADGGLGPEVVHLDTAFPVGTLYFYPVPASAVSVTLLVQTQLAEFPDLTTNVVLAPGYERMIVFSLAEEVAADYEREVPPTVTRNAASARRAVKRANSRVPSLALPAGLPGVGWGGRGYWG